MRLIILIVSLLITLPIAAQRKLDAFYNYGIFKTADSQIYIENYIRIVPNTYRFKKLDNGNKEARISVRYVYKKGASIILDDKFEIGTGEIEKVDTTSYSIPSISRHPIEEGKYQIFIELEDLNSDGINKLQHVDSIFIYFNKNKAQLSYPWFVESAQTEVEGSIFNKSGINMIPYEFITWDNQTDFIKFYQEVYDTDKYIPDSIFVLSFYLQEIGTEKKIDETLQNKILKTKNHISSFNYLPIKDINPGYYYLNIDVNNIAGETLTQSKVLINLVGKEKEFSLEDIESVGTEWLTYVNNRDTLEEYIKCLAPISSKAEVSLAENILKSNNIEALKKYVVSFWYRKDAENREKAFNDYKFRVGFVNANFSTPIRRGYQTDRGRVFLQYGSPDVRSERPNEPHAYPYEIWWYYKLKTQTNRKFVFYTTDEATNDYELLHSDAIGERRTPNWEIIINGRGKKDSNIDNMNYQKNHGAWGSDLWNLPR